MDKKRKNHLEARAKVLKAMAHPSRLLMIEELSQGERCVCELTEMVGADVNSQVPCQRWHDRFAREFWKILTIFFPNHYRIP